MKRKVLVDLYSDAVTYSIRDEIMSLRVFSVIFAAFKLLRRYGVPVGT